MLINKPFPDCNSPSTLAYGWEFQIKWGIMFMLLHIAAKYE